MMQPSPNTEIQQWIENQVVFEIIQDTNKIDTVVQHIEQTGGGNIQIEILQFVSIFSLYQQLEQKRKRIVRKISETDDLAIRLRIEKELTEIEQQESQFIRDVLYTAHVFTQLKWREKVAKVAEYFFAGHVEEANACLNPEQIDQDQQSLLAHIRARTKLEEAYQKLEDNSNEFRVKARLTMLNFDIPNPDDRFEKAIFYYERGFVSARATQINPLVAFCAYDFGNFLLKHNQYDLAPKYYTIAADLYRELAITQPDPYQRLFATTLNNQANIYKDRHELGLAREKYLEALAIRTELAKGDSPDMQVDMANILNNLANLHMLVGELSQAEQVYLRALDICQELVKNNGPQYRSQAANILNNLANLYKERREHQPAQERYEQALNIYRSLADTVSQNYLGDVAMALNNLALLLEDKHEVDKAQSTYEESLALYKKLSEVFPRAYLPYWGMVQNNLAVIHRKKDEMELAKQKHQEALEVYRKLVNIHPQAYFPYVAGILNNLGNLFWVEKEWELAEEAFIEARDIYVELAEENHEAFIPQVANMYNNLAVLYNSRQQADISRESYERALEIRRKLAVTNPQTYLPELAQTAVNMGVLYAQYSLGDEQALAYFKEGIIAAWPFKNYLHVVQDYFALTREIVKIMGPEAEKFMEEVMQQLEEKGDM